MLWKLLSRVQLFTTSWVYSPWNSPGQNTGVGSLSLLQGIFPTQGSNPGLPHCRCIHGNLSHKGSLRILEWVSYPFSRGSSRPRNQTRVSCIAGGLKCPKALCKYSTKNDSLLLWNSNSGRHLMYLSTSVVAWNDQVWSVLLQVCLIPKQTFKLSSEKKHKCQSVSTRQRIPSSAPEITGFGSDHVSPKGEPH